MTIRGIAFIYLLFVLLPLIAAIVIVIIAANKRKKELLKSESLTDATKKPPHKGRLRRFFTITKK
jgi:hypothetical protein